jgi:hypothetical protein
MTHIANPTQLEHPQLQTLPEWPTATIAVLATVDPNPYAIPVSARLRAEDRLIVLSLHRSRGSLARLRKHGRVALTVLTEGDIAFTARGRAHIVDEHPAGADDYTTVAIDVDQIDDHRPPAFRVEAGIARRWIDEDERRALGERVERLRDAARTGRNGAR